MDSRILALLRSVLTVFGSPQRFPCLVVLIRGVSPWGGWVWMVVVVVIVVVVVVDGGGGRGGGRGGD
jgi:hypothetical protein